MFRVYFHPSSGAQTSGSWNWFECGVDGFYRWSVVVVVLLVVVGPVYIQQDAMLHNLFMTGNCSTYFGWYFHPSSGAQTTVSTASGFCHTVTAICCYRGRVGTVLSVVWMAYATHSTLKPVPTLPR
jgi:hypothetical protein